MVVATLKHHLLLMSVVDFLNYFPCMKNGYSQVVGTLESLAAGQLEKTNVVMPLDYYMKFMCPQNQSGMNYL